MTRKTPAKKAITKKTATRKKATLKRVPPTHPRTKTKDTAEINKVFGKTGGSPIHLVDGKDHMEDLVEYFSRSSKPVETSETVRHALPAEDAPLAFPVYQHGCGFYFRDATWLHRIGPFEDRKTAVESSRAYEAIQSLQAQGHVRTPVADESFDPYISVGGLEDVAYGPKDAVSNAVPAATDADRSVKHPNHYNAHPTGIECIDVNQHFNANLGAAIKYIWRTGLKSPGVDGKVRDLQKAREYIDFEIDRIRRFEEV